MHQAKMSTGRPLPGVLLVRNECESVERVMGIEPTLFAWEARVLPLNDTRLTARL